MKEITIYEAKDKKRFDNQGECFKYECLLDDVEKIMNTLVKIPDNCGFSNGDGYIQQDRNIVLTAKRDLLLLATEYSKHECIKEAINQIEVNRSLVGRIISECCPLVIDMAWNRISCMDESFREYGQLYFVSHRNEVKNICLNK